MFCTAHTSSRRIELLDAAFCALKDPVRVVLFAMEFRLAAGVAGASETIQ